MNENTTTTTSAFPAGLVYKNLFTHFLGRYCNLSGKSARGEYWATFVVLALPVSLINGLISFLIMLLFPATGAFVGTFLAVLSVLLMFPVTVRRVHDFGLTGWLPAGILMSEAVFWQVPILCLLIHLGVLGALITFGCIPSKASAPEKSKENVLVIGIVTLGVVGLFAIINASCAAYQAYDARHRAVSLLDNELDDEAERAIESLTESMIRSLGE